MADQSSPSTRTLARSRGAVSGILLVLLGAWGALAPFIGPSFNFAYTPDKAWHWTAARGWFEVLPGAAAFVAGLILLLARSRAITLLGAWLGIVAGAWFVVGLPLQQELTLGSLGVPIGTSSGQRAGETLALFTGLGALIIFFAAMAFGRLSVVTARDLRHAERREADRAEAEELAARDQAERDAAERESWSPRQEGRDDQVPQVAQQTSEQPFDQHAAQQPGEQSSEQSGYHSALGYRGGEQPSGYTPPSYGRHDAEQPTTEQPTTGQPAAEPAPGQSR
jgi:hypothetical protein